MKNTGMVRNVDHLGRIVLPKEIRKSLNLSDGTPMDISVDGETILLKRHHSEQSCAFCGKEDPAFPSLNGVSVCPDCLAKLREL